MRFSIKQALASIVSSPFTSIFLILTFVGGFLCLYITAGYADAFFKDTRCLYYGEKGDYFVNFNSMEPLELDAEALAASCGAEDVVMITNYYLSGDYDDMYVSAVPCGYDSDYYSELVDGRRFTSDDYVSGAVYLIESNVVREHGYSVGDSCMIADSEYTIVGIFKSNNWSGRYVIPDKTVDESELGIHISSYTLLLKQPTDFSLDRLIAQIRSGAETDSGSNTDVFNNIGGMTGDDYLVSSIYHGSSDDLYLEMLLRAMGSISVVGSVALAIFVYTFLSLMGIAEFRRESKKREIGVRLALGARIKQVWLCTFIEYLLLLLAAMVILFLSTPPRLEAFADIVVVCFVIYIIPMSVFAVRMLSRDPIVSIREEEN